MEGAQDTGVSNDTDKEHIHTRLCGYVLVSWDKVPSKSRWLAFQSENCKLYVYKTEFDPLPIRDIDISRAVFLYDAAKSESGHLSIRSGTDCWHLETGSVQSRDYWLQRLRVERQSYGCKCTYLLENPKLRACFTQTRSVMVRPHTGLISPISKKGTPQVPDTPDKSYEVEIDPSVILRHPSTSSTSPNSPTSRSLPLFKLSSPRENDGFPHPSLNTFSSLGKRIRHSFRERRRSSKQNSDTARRRSDLPTKDCDECKQLSSQLTVVQEDLKATEDEFEASRKVIEILQEQVEVLTRENKRLSELNKQGVKYDDHKILGILKEKETALVQLENKYRKLGMQEEKLEGKVARLQDDAVLYKELLQAKDKAIIDLTNEIHILRGNGVEKCTKNTQTDRVAKDLNDAIEAFQYQNQFLNEELVKTSELLQQSAHREEKLLVEASEWEARFYQIQSKYMLILNELQAPECNQDQEKFRELVSRLMGDCVTGSKPSLRSSNKTCDVYGFQQLESVASNCSNNSNSAVQQELSISPQNRWDGIVTMLDSGDISNFAGLKSLIRAGIPYHHRGLVWKAVMNCHLRGSRKFTEPDFYKTVFHLVSQPHVTPAAKQIETDLLRTLPNNRHYEGMYADGIPKLRRVLLAYSIYNPEVGYCQGLNRLVAIMLLFMCEEDAFWGLVYIVENLLPPDYYGLKLTGAQIDQRVLKDLIAEKLPRLSAHLAQYHVDISLVTFNWFLCIFVDSLPVELFMRVWDAFWFEGSKVLFRYALAVLKLNEAEVLKQTDYVTILTTMKNRVEDLNDIEEVTRIAFEELNPFPMRIISQKREHLRKVVKMELENLESVRKEYQRKSLESPDTNENKLKLFNNV